MRVGNCPKWQKYQIVHRDCSRYYSTNPSNVILDGYLDLDNSSVEPLYVPSYRSGRHFCVLLVEGARLSLRSEQVARMEEV